MAGLQSFNSSKIKTLTKAVLLAVGTGAILATAIMAPNAIQLFKPLLGYGKRSNYERERIRQALRALRRRRFVEYLERDGKSYIRVTQHGRKYIREYQLESLELPKQKWDGQWRLIFFDIPEEFGKARRALQMRLKTLGCFQLQKSVFVYPYECEDEIDFVSSFYNVDKFVCYACTKDLGRGEGRARNFFGLLR